MRKKIGDTLLQLGITPDLKGFGYIVDVVEMIDTDGRQKITYFYDTVAKKHGTKASRVERCIRHCRTKMNMESETFKRLFIGVSDINNANFLYTIHYGLKEV